MKRLLIYYQKYREIIYYIITGILTTIVSWGSYAFFYYLIKIRNTPSNIISWIIAVSFAFVVNKYWVFESKKSTGYAFFKELVLFFGARIFTGVIETVSMYYFVDVHGFSGMLMKIIISIVVTILNYFLSKFWIFKHH